MSRMKYKEIFTAGIGSGLEYYDFLIFGFFAPIFSPLFFPANDVFLVTAWGYAAFAVGFIFRPIGGIIFGHIGDKLGRKSALSYSIIFMGMGTLLIGILPTYEQIGILAPILLILARMIQGISIGGEFAGGTIFSVEHGQSIHRAGWAGGLVLFGAMAGTLSASIANYIFAIMPWMSWRFPFIFGFLISIIGLYIRNRVVETKAFEQIKKINKIRDYPLVDGIKLYPQKIFCLALLNWFGVSIFIAYWIFLPTYLKNNIFININPNIIDLSVPLSIFICMLTVLIAGHVSDFKIPRYKLIKGAVPLLALFLLFMYVNIHSLTVPTFFICQFIFAVLNGIWASSARTYAVEVINDIGVRYSVYAFSNNLGEILGGLTPLIATMVINTRDGHMYLGFFIFSIGMLALLAIYKLILLIEYENTKFLQEINFQTVEQKI